MECQEYVFWIIFLLLFYRLKNNRRGHKVSLQTYLFFTQNTTQHTIDIKTISLQHVRNIHELSTSSMIVLPALS